MLVAQISDIHARPDSVSLEALKEAVAYLRRLRPDTLVVTGDLVNDGWREGYRLVAESLRSLHCPIHVLAGNGDDPELMRSELSAVSTWSNSTGPMHFSSTIGDLMLIGMDVTVEGQSYGDAMPHLPWLAEALSGTGAAFLLFMHQPPIAIGIEVLDEVRCRSADALLNALEAMGRRPLAILCGHVHRPVFGRLGSIPVQTCGSICLPNALLLEGSADIAATDAPSLLVHHVKEGRLLSHVVSLAASSQLRA